MSGKLEHDQLKLNDLRLKIIKSMLAEFPDLKIQITKNILIEPKQQNQKTEEKKVTLKEYLKTTSKDSVPDWAKLAIASGKRRKRKEGYYFFK